jgi:hypothetical protein
MAIEDIMRNSGHAPAKTDEDALDLLEREDVEVRRRFSRVEEARSDTVLGRAAYGEAAKEIVQHLATREAALTEVARKIAHIGELSGAVPSFHADSSTRREVLDRLEKMSRGVQGINLNTGQDFDGVLQQVIDTIGPEIDRDLAESVPALRSWLTKSGDQDP